MKKIYIAPLAADMLVEEEEIIATSLDITGLDGIDTDVTTGLEGDNAEVMEYLWEDDVWGNNVL